MISLLELEANQFQEQPTERSARTSWRIKKSAAIYNHKTQLEVILAIRHSINCFIKTRLSLGVVAIGRRLRENLLPARCSKEPRVNLKLKDGRH
jgi:hypothetical protein